MQHWEMGQLNSICSSPQRPGFDHHQLSSSVHTEYPESCFWKIKASPRKQSDQRDWNLTRLFPCMVIPVSSEELQMLVQMEFIVVWNSFVLIYFYGIFSDCFTFVHRPETEGRFLPIHVSLKAIYHWSMYFCRFYYKLINSVNDLNPNLMTQY